MSMMRRSAPNDRSGGPARWRISGNRSWRFCSTPDLASLEILRRVREAGYEGAADE
jgi:hypothetical protein